MEFKRFLLSLIIVGVLSAATTSTAWPIAAGGYNPIKDPSDPYVVEIGKFAVSEHNKGAATKLVFVSVLSGAERVLAGHIYKLEIKAKFLNNVDADVYQAIVYDNAWDNVHHRTLDSFTKLNHN